jgi:hypothetical protein
VSLNPTQAAAVLFGGAGLVVAWFAVPPAQGPSPGAVVPSDRVQADAAATLTVETARLRTFIDSRSVPQAVSRNVFRFDEPRARSAPPPPRIEVADQPLVPNEPPAPMVSLIGIAEDATSSGPVRTAVISGLGQLFLVKDGEEFGGMFRVLRIGAESVELLNTRDNLPARIALK